MHTCTPPDAVFDGPITNLHSALCILLEIPLCAHAKGGEKKAIIMSDLAHLLVVFRVTVRQAWQ